jgi:hypothetical protein
MKTFTIENETNNIMIHASAAEAEAILDSERFTTEEDLSGLAANWPAARLVEIWNSLSDVTEVKKFKDRATAVSRIWKAIQGLGEALPSEAEQPEAAPIEVPQEAESAPVEEAATEPEAAMVEAEPVASPEADVAGTIAPQPPDVAAEVVPAKTKATRAKETPTAATGAPREGSKTSQVVAMLKREGGTTLEEIMSAMNWQKHTTRAMLSAGGSLTKNHGLIVVSEKVGEKRVYFIKA